MSLSRSEYFQFGLMAVIFSSSLLIALSILSASERKISTNISLDDTNSRLDAINKKLDDGLIVSVRNDDSAGIAGSFKVDGSAEIYGASDGALGIGAEPVHITASR